MITRENKTSIGISNEIKDALAQYKQEGETWDDIIRQALYIVENTSEEEQQEIIKKYGQQFNPGTKANDNNSSN